MYIEYTKIWCITLSETWLKDNPHLLDYVKIDCYEAKFRNREHTRGGSVGLYIRWGIIYKLRNDIVNTNTRTFMVKGNPEE